ncbi:MAG TPA: hypothetical protein VLC53_20225 [Myxococcota bacterium]|nr:hypothetical protein [Myxococcota bacterium]
MFRRAFAGPAAALSLGLAASAGGEVVIDAFVTQQILQLPAGSALSTFGAVAAGDVLGGERDAEISRVNGNDAVELLVNPVGDELLSCSASAGTTVIWRVTWDGPDGAAEVDPDGLGGVDLTQGGANEGFLLAVSADVPATIEIAVTGAAGGTTTGSLSLPGGQPELQDRFLPFTEFDEPGLLADAGSVSLVLSGSAGLDAQIDGLRVPEAEGAAAAVAALCALLALTRRGDNAARPRG